MRIGIDLRMAGTGEGIARYVEELVKYLSKIDSSNDYLLLFQNRANSKFKIQNSKFRIVFVDSSYYSLAEQTKFIWELKKLKLDLMHFPSFNAPICYPGKFIVTVHDVIHHLYPGKKKSRFFHRWAYRLVIKMAVKRAKKIIAVSRATKEDIIKTFKVDPLKIEVIYEGVEKKFYERATAEKIKRVMQKFQITKPYWLFAGVWRQYKNLPCLAQAFDILKEWYHLDCQLVLAGKIDPFYPEIKQAVFSVKNAGDIKALGFVSDEDLIALYQGAEIFVLPSLVEGFGLIGLEAQAANLPVAASNIPVLKEVLGEGAIYFDPNDPEDLAVKISNVFSDPNLKAILVEKGKNNLKRFSWQEAAKKTLKIYEQVWNTNNVPAE